MTQHSRRIGLMGQDVGGNSGSREPSPATRSRPVGFDPERGECHGLDSWDRVCFYEQDFYVLSNFSSFTLRWRRHFFYTSEAAYHWEKFMGPPSGYAGQRAVVAEWIREAPSAHEAFKIAQEHKDIRRADWDDVKVEVMREILRAKADQHEYVRRKLLATGDRELVENSWRDDFWGWGPNCDGQNMLGKLWMEIRDELASAIEAASAGETTKIGSTEGESAVGDSPDAQNTSEEP